MTLGTRFTGLLALGALLPAPLLAGPAPRWVRDASPAVAPAVPEDCPAVVLYDRTELRLARDLAVEAHRRRVVLIRTEEGLFHAGLRLRLEPGARLSEMDAWTVSRGDTRATADRAQRMESALSPEGYGDTRVVSLRAPEAVAGDVVAFEASWSESDPFPLHLWFPQEENLPVLRAELEMALPKGWTARIHGYHLAQALPERAAEHVSIALSDLPILPDEPRRPGDSALLPRVVLRFPEAPGGAAFDRWETIAAWYADLSRSSVAPGACPRELADVRGTPAERVADLARLVQEKVRYVAIELGMQRWVPDPADATWQRLYGDCKDKAALLVSALAANGIEARLALACPRDVRGIDPDSPDPLQFNHCIVALAWPEGEPPAAATVQGRSGRRWTFFDPTDAVVPLGSISPQLGGTWSVIGDSAEGLVRMPDATVSTVTREVRGRLANDGTFCGRVTLRALDPAGAALLSSFGPAGPDGRRRQAREWLARRWPQAVVDSCWIARPGPGGGAGVDVDVTLPALARPMGTGLLVVPGLLSAWPDAPPRDSARTLPIVLGGPTVDEEHWDVELPPGFDAEQRPPRRWSGALADYSMAAGGDAGRLTLRRRLELRRFETPAEGFAEARDLWRAVYSGDRPTVMLRRR